jgi:hypothetical protein
VFAVIAVICGIVAAILHLVGKHGDIQTWLVIIGLVAVSIEVAWGWHRGGYYRHPPA